jgi:cation transport ATPase
MTGDWKSWAYAWALIPGFVGVGVFIANVLQGKIREAITAGGWLVVISLFLFFIFGSFLGGINLFGVYWPVLLIILGLIGLSRAFVGR